MPPLMLVSQPGMPSEAHELVSISCHNFHVFAFTHIKAEIGFSPDLGSPNYGPRATSGPPCCFIWPVPFSLYVGVGVGGQWGVHACVWVEFVCVCAAAHTDVPVPSVLKNLEISGVALTIKSLETAGLDYKIKCCLTMAFCMVLT